MSRAAFHALQWYAHSAFHGLHWIPICNEHDAAKEQGRATEGGSDKTDRSALSGSVQAQLSDARILALLLPLPRSWQERLPQRRPRGVRVLHRSALSLVLSCRGRGLMEDSHATHDAP
eukprot:921415-Pleurochrysis_carterae.AAC.1